MLHADPVLDPALRPIDGDNIAASLRQALDARAAELHASGFVTLGYGERAHPLLVGPEVLCILYHPERRTVATVRFGMIQAEVDAVFDFYTCFEDGSSIHTAAGRAHTFFGEAPGTLLVDPLTPVLAEQLAAHEAAVASQAGRAARALDLSDFIACDVDRTAAQFRFLTENGHALPTDDPARLTLTASGARIMVRKLLAGHRRLASSALAKHRPDYARVPAEELARHAAGADRFEAGGKRSGLVVFAVSAVLFAISGGLISGAQWLAWIIPLLLLHELGHYVAMRAFGQTDARIFFIPLFGAATSSNQPYRSLSHEMVVLLAGPLPGILLAVALFQVPNAWWSGYLVGAGILLLVINGLNLLPLYPMDGGRIVHALLTAGRPKVDLGLKLLASAVFLALGLHMHDTLMLVLGGLGLLTVRSSWAEARLEAQLRTDPAVRAARCPEERRMALFRALGSRPRATFQDTRQMVRSLEHRLAHDTRPLPSVLPWALAYAGALGGTILYSVGPLRVASAVRRCPERRAATPVACPPAAAIDWSRLPADAVTRNPYRLWPESQEQPLAGIVRCTFPDGDHAFQVHAALREVLSLGRYCVPPPWQRAHHEPDSPQNRARSTAIMLDREPPPRTAGEGRRRAEAIGREAARWSAARHGSIDMETAEMLRKTLASGAGPADQPWRALQERLGAIPGPACDRLRILRVAFSQWDDQEPEDAQTGPTSLSFSVTMTAAEDFAPLARYLCASKCAMEVAPQAPADPRLRSCE